MVAGERGARTTGKERELCGFNFTWSWRSDSSTVQVVVLYKKTQINYFKARVYRVIFFFPVKVPLRTQNSGVIFPLQLPVQHRTRLSLDGLVLVTGPGTERVLGSTGHLLLLVPRGWTGFG